MEIPRRNQVQMWVQAERAIAYAVEVVERVGCDPRLTDAINLLHEARMAVADYVDQKPVMRWSVHKSPAAVALGQLGGRVTSAKKAHAARENGKKGGRPRKDAAMITDTRIEALKQAAAQAGDEKQVAICTRALFGSQRARAICERVIKAAQ